MGIKNSKNVLCSLPNSFASSLCSLSEEEDSWQKKIAARDVGTFMTSIFLCSSRIRAAVEQKSSSYHIASINCQVTFVPTKMTIAFSSSKP
uniref:Ovule protein n=1 Tax=Steinernema glaseri TaxID=37863 RepID=A0A1I7YU74_9BILA